MASKMSAHDRKYQFFETPPHYIAALLGEVNLYGRVYEPCVGEGAIADALRQVSAVRKVYTNDIDHKRKADTHGDARLIYAGKKGEFDWHVTNPPFSDELEILENSLDQCDNVAFLARLSFLEPAEDRAYLLESRPPQQVVVLPRYSFRPNDEGKRSTDSVTCAWLVWHADKQQRGISAWSRAKAEAYAVMRGLAA